MRKSHLIVAALLLILPVKSLAGEYNIVSNTLPPLKFSIDGNAKGITVDILAEIMKSLGTPIDTTKIKGMSWARAYEDTLTIPNTIILSMARTKEREKLFKWVGPIFSIQLELIGHKGRNIRIKNASDAALYRVGSLRNTAPEQLLVKMGFPKDKLIRLAKTDQSLEMLKRGRIDLFAHTGIASYYMMPTLGMNPANYKGFFLIRKVDLYIGFNKAFSDEFINRAQSALETLKTKRPGSLSKYDQIIQKYVPKGMPSTR